MKLLGENFYKEPFQRVLKKVENLIVCNGYKNKINDFVQCISDVDKLKTTYLSNDHLDTFKLV